VLGLRENVLNIPSPPIMPNRATAIRATSRAFIEEIILYELPKFTISLPLSCTEINLSPNNATSFEGL